ncbi:hypothetical protein BCF55_1310 [Hydrogenivirga caldilitoris]|uniref:Type IV pilus assembly protein PilX n=1 Tax=Hydrogenivirga caldilitoris TaxID=246264 RepID=A0A497XRX9_9AQUI|nr:hypothetical protein [Hydrogenivirga caldilitoris]RLJ71021.1 hypothetical protein BCF55_1310 [Hydrogenivirga caldilitoris]
MGGNERGIALITTLILGLIALVIIAALMFMLVTGTQISGISKRYSGALEAAKGASEYIVQKILDGTLSCNGGGVCSAGGSIDLETYVSNIPGYTVSATYLGDINRFGTYVYAIQVEARGATSAERAIVEFVYRVE